MLKLAMKKTLYKFLPLILMASQAHAFPTIACENGLVSKKDSFEKIKHKCASVKMTTSSSIQIINGTRSSKKQIRLVFKNNSEIVLIYLNDHFFDSVTFNQN